MSSKHIHIDELERGPIRHAELPPALIARINDVRLALQEVYPATVADWLDDFQRDVHPEQGVIWWERLAQCYLVYRDGRAISVKQRKAAFRIFFNIGMGGTPDTLSVDLAILPEEALADLGETFREHGL